MSALERAQDHHRDACLDNHSEEDCVAIQLAQELEPAPCVMTRTEPFDFAQCETHDTTFPLGGTCKFNGREVWEVYADEADEQRQRAVRLEMKLELLEQKILAESAKLKPETQYKEGLIDGMWRAARIVKS